MTRTKTSKPECSLQYHHIEGFSPDKLRQGQVSGRMLTAWPLHASSESAPEPEHREASRRKPKEETEIATPRSPDSRNRETEDSHPSPISLKSVSQYVEMAKASCPVKPRSDVRLKLKVTCHQRNRERERETDRQTDRQRARERESHRGGGSALPGHDNFEAAALKRVGVETLAQHPSQKRLILRPSQGAVHARRKW